MIRIKITYLVIETHLEDADQADKLAGTVDTGLDLRFLAAVLIKIQTAKTVSNSLNPY